MKTVVSVWVAIFGLLGVAAAQDFVVPQVVEEIPTQPVPERIPAAPDPKIEGIVAKIFNVDRPWQLVNPAAPKEFGDGRTNGTVSRDPNDPGKPKGFILFALDW